jgi:hypothetical protein
MNEHQTLLVRLLAKSDSVWAPQRLIDWQARMMQTVLYEHRRDFATGFSFASKAGRATDRKAFAELLAEFVSAGLIERFGGERKVRVRLSEAGDDMARAIVGLPGRDAAYRIVCELAKRPARQEGGCALEIELAGLADYGGAPMDQATIDALEDAELRATPGLWRGWLSTVADLAGRVWYCCTTAGLKIAAGPPVKRPAKLPKPVDGAFDLYGKEFGAARKALRAMKPDDPREIGVMPCSASTPTDAQAAAWDASQKAKA